MLLRLKTKIKALEGRYGKNIPARRAFNRALERNSRAESVALARDLASFFQTRLRAGGDGNITKKYDPDTGKETTRIGYVDGNDKTIFEYQRVYEGGWKEDKKHGQGTFTYSNGDVLTGEGETVVENEKGRKITYRINNGTLTDTNGDVWTGTFEEKGDVLSIEQGTLTMANGDTFTGTFYMKYPLTIPRDGVMTYADGRMERGFFASMAAYAPFHARRKEQYPHFIPFMDECPEGARDCEEDDLDGTTYRGEWTTDGGLWKYKGTRKGTISYKNGDVYEGEYLPYGQTDVAESIDKGKLTARETYGPHGRGTMTYANGDVVAGEWKDGYIYNGEGVVVSGDDDSSIFMLLRPGDRFEGKVKEGVAHGTITYGDNNNNAKQGDVYEGVFRRVDGSSMLDATRRGHGTMTYANGDVYEGEWEHGFPKGHGTMTYRDGDVREGEWKTVEHGKGKQTDTEGNVVEGTWEDGDIDHGTVAFANGDRYVGDLFGPFLPGGEGTMTYKDGNVVKGTWEGGELTSP